MNVVVDGISDLTPHDEITKSFHLIIIYAIISNFINILLKIRNFSNVSNK